MTDPNPSQNQPPLPPHGADPGPGGAASNGHQPHSPSGSDPYLQYLSNVKTWLNLKEQHVELETRETHLRRLSATAERAEAQAEEADHVAAATPEREQMALLERTVALSLEVLKYVLATLLTLAIISLQVAGFVVSPWFFSLNLLIVCLGIWARRFTRKEKRDQKPTEQEGDP